MSVLVGYPPESRGQGSLELGRMLAVSAGLPLVICCVVPDRWQSIGPGRQVDRDYESYLHELAAAALVHARETLGDAVDVRYEAVTARSGSSGLLESLERFGARMLVMGSSSDGAWGHVALGSVTDRMLHSAPVPVALAPRGYRSRPGARVERMTVAVDGTRGCREVLRVAAEVADDVEARLRIVTFAVRHGTMYPPEVGLHAEDRVFVAWQQEAERIVEEARASLSGRSERVPELHVAEGRSWAEALDEPGWGEGEVLVIGSSAHRPLLSRVFLGSTATRIIRHSPVPVVVVP